MRNGHWPRQSEAACSCTADGGGDSAGALNGRFAASANGALERVLGVHVGVGIDEQSDHSAIAIARGIVQRRVPARQTAAGARRGALRRCAASANGAPDAVLGVHVGVGIDERSDDSAIAVEHRIVQRGPAIAVHGGAGVRGWAPQGYPSTQPVPETQNSRLAPRVD
jgi:hypothetical protein